MILPCVTTAWRCHAVDASKDEEKDEDVGDIRVHRCMFLLNHPCKCIFNKASLDSGEVNGACTLLGQPCATHTRSSILHTSQRQPAIEGCMLSFRLLVASSSGSKFCTAGLPTGRALPCLMSDMASQKTSSDQQHPCLLQD